MLHRLDHLPSQALNNKRINFVVYATISLPTMKHADLFDSIGYVCTATARELSRAATKAFHQAGYALSFEQWTLLVSLWNKDGQCQHELASCQGKDRPTITRLVDKLERNNLVLRVPSKSDRRVKMVYLTHQAKEMQSGLMTIYDQLMKRALLQTTHSEIENCKAGLLQIQKNLKQ
jgi:DNA-binding MarR family transcriptional regulator